MRPASLLLLTIGVGLLLGTALVASFKIPCRDEIPTSPIPWYDQITRIDCNVWGQPLWAASLNIIRADAYGRALNSTFEEGPYPNYVRQGKWRRAIRELGKSDVTSDVWYLDGREVSAAEWEQRQ